QTINAPTQLAGRIFGVVRDLLTREIDGTSFRLIGAGVSALRPATEASDDSDLIDRRSAHAERAMDDLRKKFGDGAVIR
ncbi:UNVERIFIED_CONTAM: DNA polymerase IV, partial [Bacteroidetes bacterium 56_B9]